MFGFLRNLLPGSHTINVLGIDRKAAFHPGKATRTNYEWQPEHFSGESAIGDSWDLTVRRIRDQVRNNPILVKALHQLISLVVGTGILTFSDARTPDGEEDEDFVNESDTWFTRWAETEADAEGNYTWWDMQRLSFSETVEVGNHFLREVWINDPKRTVPLAYQMLEWEQLSRERDRPAGPRQNRISNGIEYDRTGRKVAYYFYNAHPFDAQVDSSEIVRVPARKIIHNYLPSRSSAKSGMSWFIPVIQPSRDMDKFLADELSSRSIAALLTLVHKSARYNRGAGLGLDAEDPETGVPLVKLGRPFVARVGQEDEVELLQSSRSGEEAQAYLDLMFNLQAMGSRLSLNRLMGDPSKANFASIKSSQTDDGRMVAPIFQHQATRIAKPVRRRHIEVAVGTGRITSVSPTLFQNNWHRYTTLAVVGGSAAELQPKDEGEAAIDRMRSGRTSLMTESGELGIYWKDTLRQMATVNKYAERLGVVLDHTKGQGGHLEKSSSVKTEASTTTTDEDE